MIHKHVVLIAMLSAVVSVVARAHPQSLSVESVSGIGEVNKITLPQGFSGSIICAQDNAHYTAAGFKWPWGNVLTVRGRNSTFMRAISTPKHNFVFSPRWSLNKEILFDYGTDSASFSLYAVACWDGKSLQAQTLLSDLSWKIIQTSPSSRFLAFIRGGQPILGQGGTTPASLCTFDLQTKTEKRWGEAEPIFGSVAWGGDDTLLFSLKPTDAEQKAMRPADTKIKPLEWKPKIYAASLATGQVNPLIEDAQRPAPSPDGKWLVFLSSCDPSPPVKEAAPTIKPDPTIPQAQASNSFLVLSRADGSEPPLVSSEARGAPNIVWFPDSSGFALCDTHFAGGC